MVKGFCSLVLLVAGGLPAARAQVVESQLHCCAYNLGEPLAHCITIDTGTGEEIDEDDGVIIIAPRRTPSPDGERQGPEMPNAPDRRDDERPDSERRRPDPRDVPRPTLQIVPVTPEKERRRDIAPPPPQPMPIPRQKPKPGSDKPN
jgi:hypothetical protein